MTRNAHGARAAMALVGVAAALMLAGCGGSKKPSTTATTSSTTTASTTTAKGPAVKVPTVVTEDVHSAVPGSTWQPSLTAKPGDKVLLRTVVPGTATSGAMNVKLTISKGPSKSLIISATGKGHTASTTIRSATGKPLILFGFHYACLLPPAPTFCPSKQQVNGKSGFEMKFRTVHPAPIVIGATVGPTKSTLLNAKPAGKSVVPAYLPAETVRRVVATPATGTPKPPTAAISAKPGDQVTFRTRLTGTSGGAPQTVTVDFAQGPAKKLTITATLPGGKPARATISSASGSAIEMVLPHFVCYAPPIQSFCPPTTIKAGSHRYALKFSASPASAPIDIIAKIQAG